MPVHKKPLDETKGQIGDRVLERIVADYGLEESWIVLPIIPMNGSLVVLNNRHTTTMKAVIESKNRRYLVKEAPWYCSEKEFVSSMTSFMSFLHKESFPIPRSLETCAGFRYSMQRKKFYYCQEFVEARVFDGSIEQIRSAGENLGVFHLLSKDYYSTHDTTALPHETSFTVAKNMTRVLEQNVERLVTQEGDQKIWDAYRQYSAKVLEKWTSKQAPNLCIHGDYNPLNLLFESDNSVVATLDFENVACDSAVHDVAEALLGVSFNKYRQHSTRFAELATDMNYEAFHTFLDGYMSTRREFDVKATQLPENTGAVCIQLISLGLLRGDYSFQEIDRAPQIIDGVVKAVKEWA